MSTEVTKNSSSQVPSYAQTDGMMGTEDFSKYVRPPRIKTIQFSRMDERLNAYIPGDVLVVPHLVVVAKNEIGDDDQPNEDGPPFLFTPLFTFSEYAIWNPIKMRSQLPVIRERSLDDSGRIAAMCRNPKTRKFPCPENTEFQCEARNHINIVSLIHGVPEIADIPVVFSFVGSRVKDGQNLISMIQLRKSPIFACIFEAHAAIRKNTQGRWFGFDWRQPETEKWVSESQYNEYKKLHLSYKEAHTSASIVVDQDDFGSAD